MDVRISQIPNGMRVITSRVPRVQSATLGVWVKVGARYEQKALSGISHFIEHLLFKGTRRRSAKEISRAIEGYGGYLNAFTQEESTCYYARVSSGRLWQSLDVLSDMYLNAVLDRAEMDKERGVIIEEIMMYRDQPQHVVHEMMMEAVWKDHALGRPIAGSPETLKGMSRAVVKKFKDETYLPGNTVVSFAGNVEHEECMERVTRMFGRGDKGAGPRFKPVTSGVRQERMVFQNKDIEQTHMAMAIRLFGRRDRRRYAMRLLNVILGENMSSRLFQVVREKHGLAYSVSSSFHLYDECGMLVISAGLDRKRTTRAIELIVREVNRLRTARVSDRELKMAKEYVIGQIRLGLESTTQQMMWLGDNIMSYGKFMSPEEVIEKMSAVTRNDLRDLADAVVRDSRATLAMISPDGDNAGGKQMVSILKGL